MILPSRFTTFFPGPYPSSKLSTDSEMPETAQVCEEKRRCGIDCRLFLEVALRESPSLLFEPLELHDVRFLEFHKKSHVSNNFLTYNADPTTGMCKNAPPATPAPPPPALSLSIEKRFPIPRNPPRPPNYSSLFVTACSTNGSISIYHEEKTLEFSIILCGSFYTRISSLH